MTNSQVDEKAFHAAWETVGWDTQNPHAESGQRRFIAAYEAAKAAEGEAERQVGELPYDKGTWVDNEMVLAIAKHPNFLEMLYAFRNPAIEDNCVVPAQVAFFAVMALKPWLQKPQSPDLSWLDQIKINSYSAKVKGFTRRVVDLDIVLSIIGACNETHTS